MTASARHPLTLFEKIKSLPAERLAQVEDFVDFLNDRAAAPRPASQPASQQEPFEFPVDDLGPWPDGLSLRREDIYGDDER